jgi:DNA-binding ferritin-like protein
MYKVKKMVTMKKTMKRNTKLKKSGGEYSHSQIVCVFLEMLNMVKLHHWKTHSFSTHKATDELYDDMSSNVDEFVEVLLGKDGSRINLTNTKSIPLYDFNSIGPFKQKIAGLKTYLEKMSKCPSLMNNSDLLNIRDELLANLNKFTYLLTLK